MTAPDPRITPYRSDLAAEHLRGHVDAARYVRGTNRAVLSGYAPLRRRPAATAALDTELLFGETVTVYDETEGWCWLQAERDGYVGYAPSDTIGDDPGPATHTLAALRSYLYPEPDLKAPPLDLMSITASVRVTGRSGAFSEIAGGGWIFSRHLAPADEYERDHAAVALRFLGTPYLWGGRTSIGLDCSGLIQLARARCGLAAPRDTDMQETAVGAPVAFDGDESVLVRGDLVYWSGHAGIWIDADRFVHANATDMMAAVAPLRDVATFIEKELGEKIRSVRRLVRI